MKGRPTFYIDKNIWHIHRPAIPSADPPAATHLLTQYVSPSTGSRCRPPARSCPPVHQPTHRTAQPLAHILFSHYTYWLTSPTCPPTRTLIHSAAHLLAKLPASLSALWPIGWSTHSPTCKSVSPPTGTSGRSRTRPPDHQADRPLIHPVNHTVAHLPTSQSTHCRAHPTAHSLAHMMSSQSSTEPPRHPSICPSLSPPTAGPTGSHAPHQYAHWLAGPSIQTPACPLTGQPALPLTQPLAGSLARPPTIPLAHPPTLDPASPYARPTGLQPFRLAALTPVCPTAGPPYHTPTHLLTS